jgi:NAD(P)-dependent dehydrogenase (short-subunit alcohol dehydrogenase family)
MGFDGHDLECISGRVVMKLKGKTAVVTGAGRGLGRAIALAMSREGARITVMSRTLREIEFTAHKIIEQGGECLVFQGDVSDPNSVASMARQTVERFSRVDVMVNNAAIIGPIRFLEDADFEAWEKTIDINLNGPFFCARAVVPFMVHQGGGKIISISSGLGQVPFPRFCAYSVSKAGIIQLTQSLSEELKGMNVQVNAIDPGVMDTSMQERIRALGPTVLGKSIHDHFVEYKEKGHLKDTEEVAALAVFLASNEADHLNGCNGTLSDYAELGWQG